MAILQPFECNVEVNGVALEEYEDEDTEQATTTTTLTKYVEAISGANFSLRVTVQPGWAMKADYVTWPITLDGRRYGGGIIRSETYDGSHSVTSVKHGVLSGSGNDWTERNFRFADIVIGDQPDALLPEEMKRRYESLGKISIEIWRMKLIDQRDHSGPLMYEGLGVVPEKALKGQALSLSADLGPAKRLNSRQKIWSGDNIEQYPVATFHFKYRSREALKQLLIIPRSSSPVPLEERDPKDLSPEEAQELIRRQKNKLEEIKAIKKEEKAHLKRDRSSTIGSVRPTKVVRTISGNTYLELDDSSDDAQIVKVEPCSSRTSKPAPKAEVIELLD